MIGPDTEAGLLTVYVHVCASTVRLAPTEPGYLGSVNVNHCEACDVRTTRSAAPLHGAAPGKATNE